MIIAYIADKLEELHNLTNKANELAEQTNSNIHAIIFKYYYSEEEIKKIKSSSNVDKIIALANILLMKFDSEAFSQAISEYYKKYKPDLIMLNSSSLNNELAAKLSSKLNMPALVNVKSFQIKDNKLICKRDYAGGIYEADYEIEMPSIITLLDSKSNYIPKIVRKADYEEMLVSTNVSRVLVRQTKKFTPRIKELKEAKLIIGVGEAIKDKKDLESIFEIASYLNAEVSCSRFLSTRRKWFDEWIGISGIRVSPKLYIGIGISGDPFHLAGILKSEKILAIITDPESNIVNYADYVAICDLYKILPKLLKKVRKKYEKYLVES